MKTRPQTVWSSRCPSRLQTNNNMARRSFVVGCKRLCSFAPYSSLGVVDWPVSGANRHYIGDYRQPGLVPTRLLLPSIMMVAGTSYPPVGNKNNIIPIRGFTNWWLCVVAGIGKIRKIFGGELMTHTRPAAHPTPPRPPFAFCSRPACLPTGRPPTMPLPPPKPIYTSHAVLALYG